MFQISKPITAAAPEITYRLTPGVLKTFADPGKGFLTFDQFVTIVQWYRDTHYAPDHVEGFADAVGRDYMVWTRSATSSYFRHVFPDALTSDFTIGFSIPSLDSRAWFPLEVRMYDGQELVFQHVQKLVMERKVKDRFVLSSWQKVPPIREFLLSQCPFV
ncbi:MAG: hypothetical protein OIF48_05385 [Silicimonas sp.]|nr:hypothetical protein [Silicimonas sp.]